MTSKQKFSLIFILLLSVFFRFYQITALPGGLFPDEAANGLDINLMQQGNLQPFYERGNGREALFFYMLWGSVEVFGKGPWQHHVVSALIGVLSVLFCFLLTKRLFNINVALLAAFLMAVSSWHVVLSRTAFRANLIPLFTALTFYLGIAAFQSASRKKQLLLSFLAGASFALGFYSYIAYRVMVPIVIFIMAMPALAYLFSGPLKVQWKKLVLKYLALKVWLAVGFVIFISPLAYYFFTHPGSFVGRSGQVSVFNPELNQGNLLGTIWEVFKQSILGYFTTGDLNWRHNISGFPFLSPLVSPFFAVGLVLITALSAYYFFCPKKKSQWWRYFFLGVWFWAMLMPVVTTAEGIPHGLRAIGTIPAVFIISALAIYEFSKWTVKFFKSLWERVLYHTNHKSYLKHGKVSRPAEKLIYIGLVIPAVCFFAALIFQTYTLYFVHAAAIPENFYSFRSDLTEVSKYLRQRCDKENTYLVLDKFSVQTTDYLTSDPNGNFEDKCSVPYRQVDPEDSWKLSNLKPEDEIIFAQSSIFDIKKFKAYHSKAGLSLEYRNKFGQAIMAVYKISK